jgi:DNA mismatch endonuclease (patch repair protein)
MVDVLTAAQRKYCMSRIRGKDTSPEMIVRRIVHALGYGYRLHVRLLPGCPDLVFSGRRKAILVHGCFWHRHRCREGQVMPATRRSFWEAKFCGNKARDVQNARTMRSQGWGILVVWECQTKQVELLTRRLARFLG